MFNLKQTPLKKKKKKKKEKRKNLPESLILHLVDESTTDVKFCSCNW